MFKIITVAVFCMSASYVERVGRTDLILKLIADAGGYVVVEAPGPPCVQEVIGTKYFLPFTRIKELHLPGSNVESIRRVAAELDLKEIDTLDLREADVDGEILILFKHCRSLRWLHLGGTRIRDEQLTSIRYFAKLETLYLIDTYATNEGVRALRKDRSGLSVMWRFIPGDWRIQSAPPWGYSIHGLSGSRIRL